jgi:hypothetical protein
LSVEKVRALYDLSLLLLRRTWSLPWTPASHNSFSTPFKQAIKTIALIAHRHGFPMELCTQINAYMSRDWWPSDDAQCWRYECQIDHLWHYLRNNNEEIHPFKPLIKCNGCKIAHACSKKHLKEIFHDGHRRLCRCPPFRVPTAEDHAFCHDYVFMESNPIDSKADQCATTIQNLVHDNQGGDYNGSNHEFENDEEWESVCSDSDSVVDSYARINMVLKYFENRAYKIQRIEDHAFAMHYTE